MKIENHTIIFNSGNSVSFRGAFDFVTPIDINAPYEINKFILNGELTNNDKIELADYMIGYWKIFKEMKIEGQE